MLKKLLNKSEEMTYQILVKSSLRNSAAVFPKIRLADVLPIEDSGITDELFRFALQSHLDFVVSDPQHSPLFAVEFDGVTHRSPTQANRDSKKNTLCERFGLPILRIGSDYLDRRYRNLDLLTWFVEVWFAQKAFDEAQMKGMIPSDEPFDPCMFVNIPGLTGQFPLWLSAEPRQKIQKLYEAKRCFQFGPSMIVGRDDDGVYRAMGSIRIDKDHGIYALASLHNQLFPVLECEALGEIVPFLIHEKLIETLDRGKPAIAWGHVISAIDSFKQCVRSVASESLFD